jgi:hypothetical protein
MFLGVEENQIAGLDVGGPNGVADFVLLFHDARDRHAVLGEHVLHEAAAIKAAGIRAAEPIRDAAKSHCELRNGSAIETGREQIPRDGCDGCHRCNGCVGCAGCRIRTCCTRCTVRTDDRRTWKRARHGSGGRAAGRSQCAEGHHY